MSIGRISKSAGARCGAIRWRTSTRTRYLRARWACTADKTYLAWRVILIVTAGHNQPGVHFNICVGGIAYGIWI